MDFVNYIPPDLVRYHILQLDRNIHTLIMCRSVCVDLKYLIDEIIKSFKLSSSIKLMKSLKDFITPICEGCRIICITMPNQSNGADANTYHYIVNDKYSRQYNYHLANRYGSESLRLICYDGLIINLFKDDADIIITIGGSPSCQYSFPAQYRGSASISVVLDSPIALYKKKPLSLN
jgi:hypothetical protein